MQIFVIIPVLNEEDNLRALLPYLQTEIGAAGQIIVSDGGSTDHSASVCRAQGVSFFASPRRGRGPQMNEAVRAHPGADVYYFLHADARPPGGFVRDLRDSIEAGFPVGCYRFSFDSKHPLLAINAFFTRFDALACRGGDQSLYVTRSVFRELGGFRDDMLIMEDYDFIERAQARYPFRIIPRSVTVSARKYRSNSWLKVQLANLIVFRMYRRGAPQAAMVAKYKSLLRLP